MSVWSSYGHRFISSDDGTQDICLTCGALYELSEAPADDISSHRYHAANGDDPTECSGDTGRAHGYERHCHEHDEPCPHTEHDCNCLLCA